MHLFDPAGPVVPTHHGRVPPLNRLELDRSDLDEIPGLVGDARCPVQNAPTAGPQ